MRIVRCTGNYFNTFHHYSNYTGVKNKDGKQVAVFVNKLYNDYLKGLDRLDENTLKDLAAL